MAIKILEQTSEITDLQGFVAYVKKYVDFKDQSSIISASKELKKLHNNRSFITTLMNDELKSKGFQKNNLYAGQSLILHANRDFLVRAVIWTPEAQSNVRREMERDINFYGVAHDHAFNLLTVGYHGAGYKTDFFEYDRTKVMGYVGEDVAMTFLESTHLGFGEMLFMRESQDIHIQFPPTDLSISLNLMSKNAADETNIEQFIFDVQRKKIIGYPHYGVSNRTGLIEMASLIGDGTTVDLLRSLAKNHSDPRTRLSAYKSLYAHTGHEILECVRKDPHGLVSTAPERGEFN